MPHIGINPSRGPSPGLLGLLPRPGGQPRRQLAAERTTPAMRSACSDASSSDCGFHHHPHERLGAGRADEHAAVEPERFRRRHRREHVVVRRDRAVADLHVDHALRVAVHHRREVADRTPGGRGQRQEPHRREQPVAGGRPARGRSRGPTARRRASRPCASSPRARTGRPPSTRPRRCPASRIAWWKPRFAMTVVTTVFCASVTSLAHRERARREHLVAVDDRARRRRRTAPDRRRRRARRPHRRRGEPTASATTSGYRAPHPSLMFLPSGSALIACTSAPRRRSSAGARSDAAPFAQSTTTRRPVEPCIGRRHQVREVAFAAVADRPRVAGPGRRRGQVGHGRFDLVLDVVGQLRTGRVEELDAVVLGRVVRGGDDHPARGAELGHEEGDRRRRLHPGDVGVAAALPDALDERVLEPLAGGPRVAAHDERGSARAVAAEHDDGSPPEAVAPCRR